VEAPAVIDIPENSNPIAQQINLNVEKDQPILGQLSASDGDDDPLTFLRVKKAKKGSLAIRSDGRFVYTPDPGFTGTDSFSFKVNDGLEDSANVTILINIL